MKKSLLKKMTKVASVALVAGAMVCGASLTASANGVPGLTPHEATLLQKSPKKSNYVLGVYNKTQSAKATKKAYKKVMGHKAAKKGFKKHGKKSNKKFAKKNRAKKLNKKAYKKGLKKSKKSFKKAPKLKKHVEKPANHKTYRHYVTKHANYRKGAYYHKVWAHAEKVNKKGEAFDLKAAKYDQKKGYKKAAKNALHMANYLQKWVNHDEQMLSLAK